METKEAHKQFSAGCFNRVWDLIDKGDGRTAAETEEMVECAHASLWHWMRRDDGTPTNLSVGLWQISRVYATVGNGAMAKDYGARCEKVSREGEVSPFLLGYALEACARAEAVAGNSDGARQLIAEARGLAEKVEDKGEREALIADLDSI